MRLWTFQFPHVLRILRRDGVYRPRWAQVRTAGPFWMLAYEWMVDELIERRLLCHRIPPIWAWYREPENKPPGRRAAESLFGPIDRDVVRLELEVSDRKVVLSEYGAWNDVMQLAGKCFQAGLPITVPIELRSSVFATDDGSVQQDDSHVELQACLPDLRWRHVCGIRRYTIPDLETTMSHSYSPPDD